MARRKKSKSSDNPMPATGAGLIRFYSEADSPGIKFGPVKVVAFAGILIILIFIANLFFPLAA